MRKIHFPKIVLLVMSLLLKVAVVFAQPSIIHASGTFCVGVQNVFVLTTGGCSNFSWSVGGAQIISQSGNTITVKWNSPSSIQVSCFYSGCPTSPSSGSASYAAGGMTVSNPIAPSVNITVNQNNVCEGSNIVFTAHPSNGGSPPSYNWKINGTGTTAGVSGGTFTPPNLKNGDVVSVTMGSTIECPTTTSVNSNSITMNLTPRSPVVATLSSNPMPLCNGMGTFSVVITNSGPVDTNTYQWYRNGSSPNNRAANTPANVYTTTSPLSAGERVWCVVTSSLGGCLSNNPATSNQIEVSVRPPSVPTLSVGPSLSSFCQGDAITFTANPGSTFSASNYQWRLNNGIIQGVNGNTFTTTQFTQGSVVTVSATASGECLSSQTATGTTQLIPITVRPRPIATINPSGAKKIKSTETQILSAQPTGSTYSYQWQKEGVAIPNALNPTYTASDPGIYTVIVADGCNSTSPSLTLTKNIPPVANAGPDLEFTMPIESFSLTGTGSDADGTIVETRWGRVSTTQLTLTNSSTPTVTIQDLVAGTHVFRYTVTDDFGESASDEVTVVLKYPPNNYNWVRETAVMVKEKYTSSDYDALAINRKLESTQYFDGLGRPWQMVQRQSSPLGRDIIKPMAYDEYGRETRDYMPYTGGTDGYFKADALRLPTSSGTAQQQYRTGKQYAFYQTGTGGLAKDQYPYAETVYDMSPLNQSLKHGFAGADWQPNASTYDAPTDHAAATLFESNAAGENILKWTYSYPSVNSLSMGLVHAGTAAAPVYYGENKLAKIKSKDEARNEIIEYKDTRGNIVLRRVQVVSGNVAVNDTNYASTYYIYDDFSRLVCVIPPQAASVLTTQYFQANATNATKESFLKRWAYRYSYDIRGRMIRKHGPGTGQVYMVYDALDRQVFTQDSVQRAARNWFFTKYDVISRPVLTGIYTADSTLAQSKMQQRVDYFYDHLTAQDAWHETYVGAGQAGNVHGYNNRSYPKEANESNYLTVTYFDRYDFRADWAGNYNFQAESLSGTSFSTTYAYPGEENKQTEGKATGLKTKVMDGGVRGGYTWLRSVTYYDAQYRTIQVLADNYQGGVDRTSTLYDFTGRVIRTKNTHSVNKVLWKDATGAWVSGNKLVRSNAASGWTAGAASVQVLAAGQNGWLEVVVSETNANNNRMIGLAAANPDLNYTSIDYAVYLTGSALQVREKGTLKYTFPGTTTPGDVIRIERTGSTIAYSWKNNTYTSTVSSTTALMVDASLYTASTNLAGARVSFGTTSTDVFRRFVYDTQGRVKEVWHAIGNTAAEVRIAFNTYNESGQLVDKKLHSTTTNAANAKQSVDYRYNIRGWLTSINNAALAVESQTNDDAGDLFGLDLIYNKADAALTNDQLYTGNVSGMKWSKHAGIGPEKQNAYVYSYDALSRLTGGAHKVLTTDGTWQTGNYSEDGITYDLNGNITHLNRNGKDGAQVDNLTYNYGATTASSNKLLYVQDNATTGKLLGFADRNTGTGADYTYDGNGNMTRDLNKAIGNSTSDGTNLITYNYMNMVETVTKGGSSIRYIYDASGNKLAQSVLSGFAWKQTDYAGDLIYENDVLQFANHDEGRVAVTAGELLYANTCDEVDGAVMTAVNATLGSATISDENYVTITSNGTVGGGVSLVPGLITIAPAERYRIRMKGYRGTTAAYLQVKAGAVLLNSNGAAIPLNAKSETWVEQIVTIPAGTAATTLDVSLVWAAVTAGEIIHVNDFEIIRLETTPPEYQYHIKDHLGNVRVSFTTKTMVAKTTAANFEAGHADSGQGTFLNYSSSISDLTDHTDAGTVYERVQKLNGMGTGRVGVAQTIPVGLGDEVSITAYGKYLNLSSAPNATPFITSLASAFGVSAASTGEALRAYQALGGFAASVPGGDHDGDDDTVPKAFVTILFFDKAYNLVDAGWDQMTSAGEQTGADKSAHDVLSITKKAPQAGYAYVFVSNEHPTAVEVHFDDVSVTHTPSVIIAENDYYPFGLVTESYTSDRATSQAYRYNGKEQQDELGLDWYDYGARMYMADLGRWGAVDPLLEKSRRWSPYNYVLNNPMRFTDPDGMEYSDPDQVQRELEWGMRVLVYLDPSSDMASFTGGESQPLEGKMDEGKGTDGALGATTGLEGQQEKPQTWYYMTRESGSPHGLAYDPVKGIIYEVNHPQNTHGLLHWLEGVFLNSVPNNGITFDETKSVSYQWNMNNKNEASDFWAREEGSTFLMMPVLVKNPATTTAWFQSQKGKSWDYNFFTNNCAHYAVQGLNAGGGGVNFVGPIPKMPGTYTHSWSGGGAPTQLATPRIFAGPNPLTGSYLGW